MFTPSISKMIFFKWNLKLLSWQHVITFHPVFKVNNIDWDRIVFLICFFTVSLKSLLLLATVVLHKQIENTCPFIKLWSFRQI